MRLPRRRTLWLSALLLAVVVGGWFVAPQSRITEENFDKIQDGMREEDVRAILGGRYFKLKIALHDDSDIDCVWRDGPNYFIVHTDSRGKLLGKVAYFATGWESLVWYVKKGAKNIGLKWD